MTMVSGPTVTFIEEVSEVFSFSNSECAILNFLFLSSCKKHEHQKSKQFSLILVDAMHCNIFYTRYAQLLQIAALPQHNFLCLSNKITTFTILVHLKKILALSKIHWHHVDHSSGLLFAMVGLIAGTLHVIYHSQVTSLKERVGKTLVECPIQVTCVDDCDICTCC